MRRQLCASVQISTVAHAYAVCLRGSKCLHGCNFLRPYRYSREHLGACAFAVHGIVTFCKFVSFGNKERIDYGTGHELNFIIFLAALAEIGDYLHFVNVHA